MCKQCTPLQRETRLYSYIKEDIRRGGVSTLLFRVILAYEANLKYWEIFNKNRHDRKLYVDYYSNLLNWLRTAEPAELEAEFNSHEIIELLTEVDYE